MHKSSININPEIVRINIILKYIMGKILTTNQKSKYLQWNLVILIALIIQIPWDQSPNGKR